MLIKDVFKAEYAKTRTADRVMGLALRLRPDTFGRVAQALAAAPTGEAWLDLAALRHSLAG